MLEVSEKGRLRQRVQRGTEVTRDREAPGGKFGRSKDGSKDSRERDTRKRQETVLKSTWVYPWWLRCPKRLVRFGDSRRSP